MIGGVLTLVMVGHLILPENHSVRLNTGGSWQLWALLAAITLIVRIYGQGLQRLRQAVKREPEVISDQMSETELERYARHIVMPEIGGVGQMRLRRARVLVIGAGGLGSPALQYLAAAGVGIIGIIDDDVVDASNLQRQVIHRDADIGLAKVTSAAQTLRDINPYVAVNTYQQRLTDEIATELVSQYDIVLDGTDNFETRYLVNKTCVAQSIPLVSGALSQWEGQVALFDPAQGGPCYQCIFPSAPTPELAPSCAQAGVFAALPGVIGSLMATEALKYILGAGTTMRGKLAIFNILDVETRILLTSQHADCPICYSSNNSF